MIHECSTIESTCLGKPDLLCVAMLRAGSKLSTALSSLAPVTFPLPVLLPFSLRPQQLTSVLPSPCDGEGPISDPAPEAFARCPPEGICPGNRRWPTGRRQPPVPGARSGVRLLGDPPSARPDSAAPAPVLHLTAASLTSTPA